MSRVTPARVAASSRTASRPAFNTSTQVEGAWQRNARTSPTPSMRASTAARRGASPSMRARTSFASSTATSAGGAMGHMQPRQNPSPPMDATFSGMLTELVHLSHNIERYIAEKPPQSGLTDGGNQATSGGAHASSPQLLKAEEIERVVRRVESHFMDKLEQLEHVIHEQKDVIVQLSRERDALRQKLSDMALAANGASAHNGSNNNNGGAFNLSNPTSARGAPHETLVSSPVAHQNESYAIRSSLVSRGAALDELEKTWARSAPHPQQDAHANGHPSKDEVQQLRQFLLEEKRQRLLVEEQTQSLTEQHAKVVHTLEQRIRKQEKQIQGIMDAFEQQQQQLGGGTAATGAYVTASVAQSTTDGIENYSNVGGNAGGGVRTPRSVKFRQRQQQVSSAASHSTPDPCNSQRLSPVAGAAMVGAVAAGLLQPPTAPEQGNFTSGTTQPYQARGMSTDIAEVIQMSGRTSPVRGGSSRTATSMQQPVVSSRMPPEPSSAVMGDVDDSGTVDDVALFLANISKELESIHDMELQRQTKIASLS